MTQRTATEPGYEFDRSTSVVAIDGHPGSFAVDLAAGWSSLVGVHGGYLCALATVGATTGVPDRSERSLSTTFLRTARPGPARLEVHEVRHGRTLSTVVADLLQQDRTVITSRLTLSTVRPGAEWGEPLVVDLPPVADCEAFTPPIGLVNFDRFELRFDPARLPFDAGRARVCGYVRPLESRPVDAAWLSMAVDAFPPPAFARLTPPIGGVSVDLTTHVHGDRAALGEDEWLIGEFEIRESRGGLAVEHGRIATAAGIVLAESFHSRSTAG